MRTIPFLLLAALLGTCGWWFLGCSNEDREPSAAEPQVRTDAKPLRLVITGHLDGRLEPCGCASAQSGGLDRRAMWFKLNQGRYDLALEGGNLIHGNDPLERHKMLSVNLIMTEIMRYQLLPLGPQDLSLGAEELSFGVSGDDGRPFLVSDLRKQMDGGAWKPPFLIESIQKAGSYRVLVLSLAGPEGLPEKSGYRILPPQKAITAAQTKAGTRGTDWDLCFLFVNFGGVEKARELARTMPGLDLVASISPEEARGKTEVFPRDPKQAGVARTQVLIPGLKGKFLLVWEGKPDVGGSWVTSSCRVQRLDVPPNVPKGKRAPGSDPEVWNLLKDMKRQIGELGLREQMAELRPTKNGARYLGDAACKACHPKAYAIQKQSKHALAWESLEARDKLDGWPATKHPDCVSCHVVGYGEKSGFVNPEKTPHLVDVGCEACHGAGSDHVKVMKPIQARLDNGETIPADELTAARKKGGLGKVGPGACVRCHDFEQSPGFNFHEMWKKIEHGKE